MPTRLEFSLRWFEKISGVFNRAAIDVLVAEVLRRHPVELKLDDRPRVLKAACTHVVYLQKLYWASMDEDALEARLEKQRRAALKREVRTSKASLLSYADLPPHSATTFEWRLCSIPGFHTYESSSSCSAVLVYPP